MLGKDSFRNACGHIVFVNSSAMINVFFKIHLAFHVLVGTLVMAYVSFETCLALVMTYFFVRMCLTLHVPFDTLIMVYIFIKMHLVFHVSFIILSMVYILVKMHLAFHVHFGTLAMTYILIRMCLTLHILLTLDHKPYRCCTYISPLKYLHSKK